VAAVVPLQVVGNTAGWLADTTVVAYSTVNQSTRTPTGSPITTTPTSNTQSGGGLSQTSANSIGGESLVAGLLATGYVKQGLTPAGYALLSTEGAVAAASPTLSPLVSAASSALSNNFMPAPAAPSSSQMQCFQVQAWNSLRPLFQMMQPWAPGSYNVESSVQQLLGITRPQQPDRPSSTGDPLVDWVDSILYNNGQPLTAGSAPIYGTYWDGMGHSAQEALSMAAPYVAGGVYIVAGMWMVGPAGLAGLAAPAIGALSSAAIEVGVNAAGGATPAMMAQAVGQGFFTGAVMGSLEAAGQLVSEMLTAANGLSFAGQAQMMGAIEQQTSKLAGLRMGGALTEALSPVGCNVNNILQACFTGEMLLDVEGGKKRADAIRVGDKLWSRNEFDPDGPLALKAVEEVFVRVSPVLHLRVGGQVLRTTGEHPFWTANRGRWLPARELAVGDHLRSTRPFQPVPCICPWETSR
jgi:hypothetical protein